MPFMQLSVPRSSRFGLKIFQAALANILILVLPSMSLASELRKGEQSVELAIDSRLSPVHQQMLEQWLVGAMDALGTVYGEWPQQQLRIKVESISHDPKIYARAMEYTGGEIGPVPWGQVIRGQSRDEPDEVRLLVNAKQDAESFRDDWTVYHELSHTLIPYEGGSKWFSEGLASYYQNIIMARHGIIAEQRMWQKLYEGLQRGRKDNEKDDGRLGKVSRNTNQYMRIYWHGMLYWLNIDILLRRESNNAVSLDSALLQLRRCCEAQSLQARQIARQLDKANDTAVFTTMFDEYESSRQMGDYVALLRGVGINIGTSGNARINDQNPGRAISKGIYTGSEGLQSSTSPASIDLAAITRDSGVGAASWSLVQGDKLVGAGGSGQYSLENVTPVNQHSLLRIGSITKTLLALSALKLNDQQRLNLNAPIRLLSSDLTLHGKYANSPVNTAMLLEHSGGLTDLSPKEMNYLKPLSLQQAMALAPKNRQLHWQPGEHESYSNAAAGLVSTIIEDIVKSEDSETFDSWFDREILQALGMTSSSLIWNQGVQDRLVQGYDSNLETPIPYWHTLFRAFGGLNSTAVDMSRLLRLLINDGVLDGQRVISSASMQRMFTPTETLMAKQGLQQGRGLGISIRQYKGQWIYSHNGDADGYLARIAFNLQSKRGYYIVINAFRHDLQQDFVTPLDEWLIDGLAANEAAPVYAMEPAERAALLGDYEPVTFRFGQYASGAALEVLESDGALYWRRKGSDSRTEMVAVSPTLFRTRRQFTSSIALVTGSDGLEYLQGGFGSYRKIK